LRDAHRILGANCATAAGCRPWGTTGISVAITWNNTIKQQFDDFSIDHMKQITGNALKLDDYQSVKTWAGQIWNQVSNDFMPPGDPWTQDQKNNFKAWMDNGMPLDDPTAVAVTWTNTIKGQFTQLDINHMKQVAEIDLSDYTSVKSNGDDIFNMVNHKRMPPGNPWSSQYIANFKTWMDAGYPES
jgi:hypothetical protein